MATEDSSGDNAQHVTATGGVGNYIAVFVGLCLLTGMSFLTTSEWWPWRDQPGFTRTFMMAVACAKALLVLLFFMHLKHEAGWKYILTLPACVMAIILAASLVPDVGFRLRSAADRAEPANNTRETTIERGQENASDQAPSDN